MTMGATHSLTYSVLVANKINATYINVMHMGLLITVSIPEIGKLQTKSNCHCIRILVYLY